MKNITKRVFTDDGSWPKLVEKVGFAARGRAMQSSKVDSVSRMKEHVYSQLYVDTKIRR